MVERLVRNEKVRGSNPLTSKASKRRGNVLKRAHFRITSGSVIPLPPVFARSPLPLHLAWQSRSINSEFMISKTSLAAAIVASLIFPLSLGAQTAKSSSPSPTPSASPSKQPTRPIPFHGMVSAVDQKNKTFTISGKDATRFSRSQTKQAS